LVALLVCRIFPPVIVRPEAEESPPLVPTFIPPANVDVAVEEELMPFNAASNPLTERLFANVEEPVNIEVEEAWKSEDEINPPEKVEDAAAVNPPEAVMENIVEEALLVTSSASPVCPVCNLSVRRFAVVEVAPTVSTERTSGVEVPIPTLSVNVVSLTIVPSSVHPDGVPPELSSVPQIRFPEESV
jgi:hypothetical protein